MVDPERIEQVKRLALAWLTDSDYVTSWALGDPEFGMVEGDAEDGSEDRPDPSMCTIVAQDLGHPSNALVLSIRGTQVEDAN